MLRAEIIETQSVWDSKFDIDTIALPMIAYLLDDKHVLATLKQETFDGHNTYVAPPRDLSQDDPDYEQVMAALRKHHRDFAQSQADRGEKELRAIIAEIRTEAKSDRIRGFRNFRMRSAHLVIQTRAERGAPGGIPKITFDDASDILECTITLTERLYCWVCGTSFDISTDVRRIEEEHAKALWLQYLRPLDEA
ncbi:hypothetical protein [Acuticoccus kandeliae]|uniref:hypothetical protein n=1 Tax=Acuticoccus kandeliae TaxID=2073160 RepID=UPI001300B74C|nr:hypothetical protein [Acuticoccus kandeliae]